MWPWQQKKDKARILLFSKLAAVCLSAHLVFLFCLFFVYQDSSFDLTLTISKTNAINSMIDVIWVKQTVVSQEKKAIVKKSNVQAATKTIKQKKQIKPVAEKPKIKKEIQKKSVVKTELKKIAESEKDQKGQIQKKVVKKTESNPVSTKAALSTKEVTKQKQDIEKKKELQKKRTGKQQKKIKRQKELEQQKQLQASIDAQASLDKQEELKQLQAQLKNQQIEVVHSYKEVAQLKQFLSLQEEIARHWKPPVGIAAESSCEVTITVDWDCQVAHMEMLKSSGILMYDIAARAALQTMEMPKWIRGKSITITFKQ